MRMSLLAAVPVAALLVLGTAACSSNSTASPADPAAGNSSAGSTVNLCSILTLDRAKQLLGPDATPNDQDAKQCSYQVAATGSSVSTQYYVDSSGQQYDISHNLGNASLKVTVSGVGDKAFFRTDLETLYARANDVDLIVQLVTPDPIQDSNAALAPTKQLAQDIVAKF